jgi:hypothetical protein
MGQQSRDDVGCGVAEVYAAWRRRGDEIKRNVRIHTDCNTVIRFFAAANASDELSRVDLWKTVASYCIAVDCWFQVVSATKVKDTQGRMMKMPTADRCKD